VIFPEANGVPADGLTLIPDHVIAFLQLDEVERVIEIVMVLDVGVTVCEPAPFISNLREALHPVPETSVLVAVTLFAVVLNTKPAGATKIIVPVPISAVAPSVIAGPVRAVYDPPVVSAEIADPPVAGDTVTFAIACPAGVKNITRANNANGNNIFIFFIFFIILLVTITIIHYF